MSLPATISIGADHAGYEYKDLIRDQLSKLGVIVTDYGTEGPESVDYPDFVHPVATDVERGDAELGIVVCGSGNGVCMTVNKHAGVRGALCWTEEIAELARQHNNANIICIPARFVTIELALRMVNTFLKTDFEGGRHERRVNKIPC